MITAARSGHPGGANACYTDGSVHHIANAVNLDIWYALWIGESLEVPPSQLWKNVVSPNGLGSENDGHLFDFFETTIKVLQTFANAMNEGMIDTLYCDLDRYRSARSLVKSLFGRASIAFTFHEKKRIIQLNALAVE